MAGSAKRKPRAAKAEPDAGHAEPLVILDSSIGRGQRRTVDIPLPRLYTHSEVEMPVHVFRGMHDGPSLLVCALLHGDELNGLEIVRRLVTHIDARQLRGTLIAVPVINVFGLIAQSRYFPDRRDLNRSFPGSATGPLASQVAHLFLNELVLKCTHCIDLHTAATNRTNLPQVRGNLDDAETRRCMQAFGAPVMVHSTIRDGSLREAATERGIKMLVYEGGETLRFNEDAIEAGLNGVLRVMQCLGMRKAGRLPPPPRQMVLASSRWVRARASGILRLSVGLGEHVTKGQPVAFVSDFLDENRKVLKAQEEGIVIGHVINPLVHRGDAIVHVGEVEPAESVPKAPRSQSRSER